MAKVLIHLGLPKTATTTLQHHLFEPLHLSGEINFLGKLLDIDDSTNEAVHKRTHSVIIREMIEGRKGVESIDELLVSDVLNVFSDEGVMCFYPRTNCISVQDKVSNLKQVFEGHDVKVLISLRKPVDYLYSLYIQLYSTYYQFDKSNSDFNSYLTRLLNEGDQTEIGHLNYNLILDTLDENFELNVLIFEDLKFDKENYFSKVNETLGRSDSAKIVSSKHKNKKKRSNNEIRTNFRLADSVPTIAHRLSHFPIIYIVAKNIFKCIKHSYLARFNFTFLQKKHSPYSDEQSKLISQVFNFDEEFDVVKFKLNKVKLKEYGYYK